MAITKPVAVYNAANNIDAQMVSEFLSQNGVEAHAILDESVVGQWTFGILPQIHKPQVWVEQSATDAAKLLLAEYERQQLRHRSPDSEAELAQGSITAVCEDCGKTSTFAASQRGTVQDCIHCGAFIDVGTDNQGDEYWNVNSDS